MDNKTKFVEGQQVWLCASMFGILQRTKGIVAGVYDDRYRVFRMDHRQHVDFPLSGRQGTDEGSAWLENRF